MLPKTLINIKNLMRKKRIKSYSNKTQVRILGLLVSMMSNSKVMITLWGNGKPRVYKALLDTGNNLGEGLAISEKTHKALGASYEKLGGIVKSAGKADLEVKGVSNPIELQFKDTIHKVKPVVIVGLRDPVNIGREMMKKLNITLSYGKII